MFADVIVDITNSEVDKIFEYSFFDDSVKLGSRVHVPFGKLSFETPALIANFDAIADAVNKAKPSSAKGVYLISCTVSGTMTPGIKVNVKELARAK